MFIIYNKDGSIKKKNFAEFIQKGNNNANFIFVGIDGLDLTDYSCYATFELPTEELGGPVAGVPIVEFSEELPYSGYNIPVTAEMTQYEGQVRLSLHIENSQGAEMYTYPVILVINDATSAPDQTKISLSQYQALLNLINSKPVPTSNLFFTVVDDLSLIPDSEWELYNEGKIFYDKLEKKFYKKDNNGAANVINLEDKTFSMDIDLFDENGEYELTANEEEIFLKCDIIHLRNFRTQYHAYLVKSKSSTIRRPQTRHIEEFYQVIEDDSYYKITYNNGTLTLELLSNLDYVEIPFQNSGVLTEVQLETVKKGNSCLRVDYGSNYYAIYVQHDYDPDSDEITFEYLTIEDNTGGIWLFSKYLIKIDRSTGDWRRVSEAEDVAFCTKTYVESLITGAVHFKGTVADLTALNAIQNPAQGDMYWVTSENSYYIWNGSAWSQTGGTVDLSNYYNKTESAQTFVDFIHDQIIDGVKTFTHGIKIANATVGCYSQIVPGANSLDFYFKETSGTLEKLFSLYADVQAGQNTTYHAIFDTDTIRPNYDHFTTLGANDKRFESAYLYSKLDISGWTLERGLNQNEQPDGSFNIKDSNGNLVLKILQSGLGEGTISYNNISPSADGTKDLGSYGHSWGNYRWKDLYLSGKLDDGNGNSITIADIVAKQDALTYDPTPTVNSDNMVTSGAIYSFILQNQNTLPIFKHSIVLSKNTTEDPGTIKLYKRRIVFFSTDPTPFSYSNPAKNIIGGISEVYRCVSASDNTGIKENNLLCANLTIEATTNNYHLKFLYIGSNNDVKLENLNYTNSSGDSIVDTVTTIN